MQKLKKNYNKTLLHEHKQLNVWINWNQEIFNFFAFDSIFLYKYHTVILLDKISLVDIT